MECVYEKYGKSTNRAVSNVNHGSMNWEASKLNLFNKFKDALANLVTLLHRTSRKRLCVYTDSPDLSLSRIITQVEYSDFSKPHLGQSHFPLDFHLEILADLRFGWQQFKKKRARWFQLYIGYIVLKLLQTVLTYKPIIKISFSCFTHFMWS